MGTKGLSKCRKILSIHISLHLFSKLGVVLLSVVVCKVLLAWGRFTVIGFHGIGFHIFVFTFLNHGRAKSGSPPLAAFPMSTL